MSFERTYLEKALVREEGIRDRTSSRGLAYPNAQMTDDYGYGAGYGYGEEGGDGGNTELLRKLWRAIRRRKWVIIALTLILTAVFAIEEA